MKRYQLWIICLALLLLISLDVDAQTKKPAKKSTQKTQAQKKTPTKKKTVVKITPPARKPVNATEDENRVKDIVAFLQYMMNTLGSSATSARDKEVLVKESYSKIFRDGKVQIEDDLDDARIVINNKDIVPYLKDVDFFFKDVTFEFTIEDLKSSTMSNGELFYKVSTRRILKGTTTEGKTITNTTPRYIEINYDPAKQDLRIVSIYTHEINEAAVLTNWWNDLSVEWKTILIKRLSSKNLTDILNINDIKTIISIEDFNISNNTYIQNIDPLDRLHNLKSLNLSGTNITDLTPLRNLSALETLDLSHTKIADLSPLKYCNKLLSLDIRQTFVTDISIVEKMPDLKNLFMSKTMVTDFSPIAMVIELQKADLAYTPISNLTPFENLVNLSSLDISGTVVQDLGSLKNLKQLITLDIDSTQIHNLEELHSLENLRMLHANNTSTSDLMPLQKLTHLETIYVDHTEIDRIAADKFLAINPKVKVIFDSDNLNTWWNALSLEWQTVLSKAAKTNLAPSNEALANIAHLDSINISGIMRIENLDPLRKLPKLQVIIASHTAIHNLSSLQDHKAILYLDISETEVSDILIVSNFTKLEILRADKSKIENIEAITSPSLQFLFADQTAVHDIIAREFLDKNPKCLLVFKTIHLNRWWNALPENWKTVFKGQMGKDTTRENFHKLVEQESFHFKNAKVDDLNAFSEFVQLKELHFSGTSITIIPRLENLQSLTSLHAINSPIQNIEAPGLPVTLQDLDLSNTPIDDLKLIGSLPELKTLNCSGTQIKRVDHLEKSTRLESLDCSNTNISKLDALENLPLKTLTCYNTKISSREIEKFKAKHPECNVVYYR